jgi:hypothetical protein
MIRITAALLLLAVAPARAVDFDACEEFFVAPIFLSSHAGTGGEMVVGDAPRNRVEVRAKIEGKKDAPEVLLTPEDLTGDIVAIGPLWPEHNPPGKWMAAHVGDTIGLRVIAYPARKETELAKFRIHLGKLAGESGYALFNLNANRVFALDIALSAWDGARLCKGGKPGLKPHWSMPTDVVRAKPAKAMEEAIRKANHCATGATTPECTLSSYVVEYRDVDGDQKVDALLLRLLPDGSRRVSAIWMRDKKGDLAPNWEGRCDGDPVALSVGVVRCDVEAKPGIIDFRGGHGRQRAATAEEARALSTLSAEEHGQEAIGTLRGVHLAETSYEKTWHHFTTDWVEMAFLPERGNFYTYYLSATGVRQLRDKPSVEQQEAFQIIDGDAAAFPGLKLPPAKTVECKIGKEWAKAGITGEGAKAVFVALAVSDPEGSGALDCWSVSSAERTAADGTKIPGGQPYHHTEARAR